MFVWLCAFLINKSLYRQIKCYFPKLTLDRQDNFFRINTNVSPYINAFDSRTVQQYRYFYSLNSRTASLISALSEIRCKWFNWHWHLDVMVISNFKCKILSIMGKFRSPELFSVVTTFWFKSTQSRVKKQCIWIKSYFFLGGGWCSSFISFFYPFERKRAILVNFKKRIERTIRETSNLQNWLLYIQLHTSLNIWKIADTSISTIP